MRDDLDPVMREDVPADLKARVAAKVAPALERNKERGREGRASAWAWLFHPGFLGGALAAGVVVAIVATRGPGGEESGPSLAAAPMQYDLEMLTNAELLDDLEVLENWESLNEDDGKEWKKKKS